MNIKITHNWLLEFLETDASPQEIGEYLSLCGPSIESVTQVGDDYVYDIEIISNRIDYASVIGIAREAAAILPRFGKKAMLKIVSDHFQPFPSISNHFKLEISDPDNLCPGKMAVIIDNVLIKPSPKYISQRLENCGIRSLNNIIDITNYVMLQTGHPCHVFDYDRCSKKIIIRHARDREKITTLDDKTYTLNKNDVIFDDGNGEIIDLPGIMGTRNSVVINATKRIVFWIETNNPKTIRNTAMRLGIRTLAASINEKNPDPMAARLAFQTGIDLYQKIAGGKISSPLYQIPTPPQNPKSISLDYSQFEKLIGINIPQSEIIHILTSLGFEIQEDKAIVPSWRLNDVEIIEDLVEEVARIYGYQNIPSQLQPPAYVDQPKEMEDLFIFQSKIKLFLKHIGLTEVINYSMISKQQLNEFNLNLSTHLRLIDPMSTDIEYLKTTLLPSLYKNIKDNTGRRETLRFFEIAKVYLKKNSDLPDEKYKLAIAANTDYFDIKGIVEAIYHELNITDAPDFNIKQTDNVFMIELDLAQLINLSNPIPLFTPINPYAVIKLDLNITLSDTINYQKIQTESFKLSQLLKKLELVDIFENKITVRFYFNDATKNLTQPRAETELERIKKSLLS